MNRLLLTLLLLAGSLTLTSCLVEDDTSGQQPTQVESLVGDSAYINFHIVDNAVATRAAEEATVAERQVYDGILCIFVGTTEATATLRAAVEIDQRMSSDASQVFIQRLPWRTLSVNPYFEDTTPADGVNDNHLYALVLLNVSSTQLHVSGGKLYHGATEVHGVTRSYFQQTLLLDSIGSTALHKGLFMTNAPQADGTVLTEISPSDNLGDTWDQANAATSLTIPIERAAAKLKVTLDSSPDIAITLNGTATKPQVHKTAWLPDNIAKHYRAVRSLEGWTWGDFGGNWATGYKYGEDFDAADLQRAHISDFATFRQLALSPDQTAYVTENTHDVSHSTPANRTRVIVEVQLKQGTVLLNDAYWFEDSGSSFAGSLYTNSEELAKGFKAWWTALSDKSAYTALASRTAEEVFRNVQAVTHEDLSVTLKLWNNTFTSEENAALATLTTYLRGKLTAYRDGRMYYAYPIAHTGSAGLGEYGVVRNNAYNLTIKNINLGAQTPDISL